MECHSSFFFIAHMSKHTQWMGWHPMESTFFFFSWLIPSLKLTVRPWKWMVGRWFISFRGKRPIFRGEVLVSWLISWPLFFPSKKSSSQKRWRPCDRHTSPFVPLVWSLKNERWRLETFTKHLEKVLYLHEINDEFKWFYTMLYDIGDLLLKMTFFWWLWILLLQFLCGAYWEDLKQKDIPTLILVHPH